MLRRLSLKSYIFIWVFLAVSLPVAVLLIAGTGYGQRLYNEELRREVLLDLQATVASIRRRLQIEHDLANGLSRVPPVENLLEALGGLAANENFATYNDLVDQAAGFFETFQGIRPSLSTVRIIDIDGDTLLKVRNTKRIPATLERLDSVTVVENGSDIPAYRKNLNELRADDVGSLPSPPGFDPQEAIFNTVMPLKHESDVVGYLAISPPYEALDRTLDVATRPLKASLFVAEINTEDSARNGLILYDDRSNTRFVDIAQRPLLQDHHPDLLRDSFHFTEGMLPTSTDHGQIYYLQYNPYPDRLISWLFGFEIDHADLITPFRHTSGMVLLGVICALLLAATLARLGVRHIAQPVHGLTRRLIGFAEGDRSLRLTHTGSMEVQEATQAFNKMADALVNAESARDQAMQALVQNAKLASVGQLAAGISHEISNPLTNIYTLTKLAQRRIDSQHSELHEDISNIREEAERASKIIRSLLNFSRQVPTDPVYFDLNTWLANSVDLIRHSAETRRVMIDLELSDTAALHGDKDMLQQALINLLINAVQASPADAVVQIKTEVTSTQARVCIRDQGHGIDAHAAQHLFDPFFTTKAEGEGTGLGLSICLGIVQDHGGHLSLENNPGVGAFACMVLPLPAAPDNLPTTDATTI